MRYSTESIGWIYVKGYSCFAGNMGKFINNICINLSSE